jgi:single-strand DNA-binding protein
VNWVLTDDAPGVAAEGKDHHMFETPITIVGNIVAEPIHRSVGEQELFKFRIASNSRRRNSDGEWEQGNTLFATVNCWGRLVPGAAATLIKGDPVIVVGYVYLSEYTDKEGNPRSSVEIRATSVGPDLSRTIARLERTRTQPEPPAAEEVEDDDEVDEEIDELAEALEDAEGLSLTA